MPWYLWSVSYKKAGKFKRLVYTKEEFIDSSCRHFLDIFWSDPVQKDNTKFSKPCKETVPA